MKIPIKTTTNALVITSIFIAAMFAGPVNTVWADGYEFFTPERGGFVNLVYVGQIRDKSSGAIVREPAHFIVSDKGSGMAFPFESDRPGRYRSPDIGEAVRELAGSALDPRNLEFELSIDGYKKVTFTNAPRKNMGVVELNFTVERDDAPAGAAAQTSTATGTPVVQSVGTPGNNTASSRSRLIFIGIAGFAIIAGAAVRTSGRRRSTAR